MSEEINDIYYNGKIFTSNPEQPYAEAMVVREGRIFWIGEQKDLKTIEGNYIDLKGRRVLPGFIDAHMHPLLLANASRQIACTPPITNSIEELLEHICKKRQEQCADKWIEGWGYDEGKLLEGRSPNRWDLDKAASDVPVILTRTCVHIIVVNSKALELAGIDRNTPNPTGGEIDKDCNGEPTGILRENAKDLVTKIMPVPTVEDSADNLVELSTKLLAHGITAITECMGNTEPIDYFDLYVKAQEKGFRQRTVLYYQWKEIDKNSSIPKEKLSSEKNIFIGGIKLFADGSVSGRTAWVDPPFLGDDENYGLPTTSEEELLEAAEFAKENKLQVVVHAMGEQAIDLIVDTFYGKSGWLKDRPSIRIEHAAMATEKAIKSAAESGIAFVTQPIFMYAEIESYLKNLGLERTKKTYPIQSILKGGVQLSFSSDAPATAWADPSNPFVALKSAVTRVAYDGTDCGEEHKVDIATAIRMYTREAQKVTGISEVGQLVLGYHADFIVLDKDVLEISSDRLDEVSVAETYINGQLVYKKL